MKISILLPYKENFSPEYPGAVSLFLNDILKNSKYKNNAIVYGSTNFDKIYKHKYTNINIKKNIFKSQNKEYVEEFLKNEIKRNSDLIEIHNRPIYVKYLEGRLKNNNFILYFHNDPLSMSGSETVKDRLYLISKCYKIIFNSIWSKKRFLQDLNSEEIDYGKLLVINQSAKKGKVFFNKKKKIITFVGKLNRSKGYDLFGKAIIKILNKYSDWQSIVIGDEPRDKLIFEHKNLKNLGFVSHASVLDYYKKASIAVVCSRWEEPFGRTSLEAAANGCAVIISNRGGLPETISDGIILNELTSDNIYKSIESLIVNKKKRFSYQKLSYKNFYLTHKFITKKIDIVRDDFNKLNKKFFINSDDLKPKIIHVTNFNERHNGRLFFNTGKRINNGFIRSGSSVLEFSDRDIQKNYKSYSDIYGSKILNEKLLKTCFNYKPDLIVLGHADLVSRDTLGIIKENLPKIKISQWFLDPLNIKGPDYQKNKRRILDKSEYIDCNFLTTSPDVIKFLPNKINNYFIPNPVDSSFETLNNYKKSCENDVFFAISHGVHRGNLKYKRIEDREKFLKQLMTMTKNIKFDVYGLDKIQPIWADNYLKCISNSKMGLNLSRGYPLKYYSSDRIVQIVGNGLVTLIDEKTKYGNFFNKDEMVFYKNISDLSESILKISKDEKLRKSIAKKGRDKYFKYFNSNIVADFIINKSLEINKKKKYLWHNLQN